MGKLETPVPRLDLAPKLNRPLSLWNPLDYLRLLYWVFFFPQALRWYIKTFGNNLVAEENRTWGNFWQSLRQNSLERELFVQGLLLTVIVPVIIGAILAGTGISVDWFRVALGAAVGVASGVAFGVESGVAGGVAGGVALGVASSVALGMASVVAGGVALRVASGVASGVAGGVALGVASGVALRVASGVALGMASGVVLGMAFGVASGVGFGVAFGVEILRPESWLLGLLLFKPQHEYWQFSRVTPLPLVNLSFHLKNWLRKDWQKGLDNLEQLLTYTLQFIPVLQALNFVLAEIPGEHLIFRVNQLAETAYNCDPNLLRFASASLSETLKSRALDSFFLLPAFAKQKIKRYLQTDMRLDTPARAAAAGFYYLYEKEPVKAATAFAVVRSLPYGEEMFTLAEILTVCNKAKELNAIANIQIPTFPPEPLFHSATWKVLASLQQVVEDIQVIKKSLSRSLRSFALNRALGELINILNHSHTLPRTERDIIINIAKSWALILLPVADEVGEISIKQKVRNPYIAGDPVEGSLFVGREDILTQLQELWGASNQLQSVVLFGHRRMGKTSILRNVAKILPSDITLAYINLLTLGNISQGVGEVLITITDAISDTLKQSPPDDEALLKMPYRSFERYLKQIESNLRGGLIIALDEFEKIEDLIEAGKIPPDFMEVLRGMVQQSPKIGFAFAGLHTLEEMTANYFQPFFASVIPIKVGFMEPATTGYLLANPDEDFPLDYKRETLEEIYNLTSGQPYLVQLIGFQLVRLYNHQVFETGQQRDPIFTPKDLETVINDEEFFNRGRYYFTGVWGQAAQGNPHQQTILKTLAPHPQGLTIEALIKTTCLNETTINNALETLKRHDVVKQTDQNWQIIVELFRRWLLNH
ncbi:ATP-binding protein [Ancylothrix sp. C2]|nr:ATP-binding protein [Ancylothrix sp. D3o]MCT7948862.1 ATP-binding protein [Ancylothrix sp. D3o]